MSRPLRLEYEGAWYHITNRSVSWRQVLQKETYRKVFLELLEELAYQYRVETHAYCLLDHQYHLLLHTPYGNLSRAIRHLAGVFTQRFNRLDQTEGPVFRGRFKSVLLEPGAPVAAVSCYLHRLPVAAGKAENPEQYTGSSFAAYIGKRPCPKWLHREAVLNQFSDIDSYWAQVAWGKLDPEVQQFYQRKKLAPILGSQAFKDAVLQGVTPDLEQRPHYRRLQALPDLKTITALVAQITGSDPAEIIHGHQGRANPARRLAIYLSRRLGQHPLNDIAVYFGLAHYGSVSTQIRQYARLASSQDREWEEAVKAAWQGDAKPLHAASPASPANQTRRYAVAE